MKALIEFDKNILSEYTKWEIVNKNNWNIISYLNVFYDANAALAFSKIFFPDFIEKDGCVILGFRYDEIIFKQWRRKFGDSVSDIEWYCNLYEVGDYFHLNVPSELSEEKYKIVIDQLAIVLQTAWQLNCDLLFPNKNLVVEVFEDDSIKNITLYSKEVI